MPDLEGQTVVITGASGGIGQAIARACRAEGAQLILGYHRQAQLTEVLAQELGGRACQLDVRSPDSLERALAGERERITGWVNNAAIHRAGLLPTLSQEQIQEQIDTNLLGPIHCCRWILPEMMQRRGGSIVNLGSVSHRRVHQGQAVYAATKGALAALTRALAYEYARFQVRINCLEAGPVDTPMLEHTFRMAPEQVLQRTPLRRLGQPEEIAHMVVFLLSSRSAYMTGACLSVDGGYSL